MMVFYMIGGWDVDDKVIVEIDGTPLNLWNTVGDDNNFVVNYCGNPAPDLGELTLSFSALHT